VELCRTDGAAGTPGVSGSACEVGRINFKFGETKSIFYLLDTDLDLWPPGSAGEPWTMRVKGEPARTDRAARGFGNFILRGEWHAEAKTAVLDLKLEESEIET